MPNCQKCQSPFEVRDVDKEFYQKFDAPEPEMCPDCRLQHRLNFRNERTLYNRTSSLSGKKIISIYHQDCPYPIYSPDEWWSDKWDGISFGRDFDFNPESSSGSFFDQFANLQKQVPRISLFNVNPTNSDYCQQAYNNKNCYLCMVVTDCEDSMYLSHTNHSKDSYDCAYTHHIELCYDCLDSDKLYGCVSCQSCQNSSNLMYCYDCIGCQDCFGCWGLRNKKNFIFNKQYTKEEYEEKIKSLELNKLSNFLKYKKYFNDISKDRINRANRNLNTIDSTGNYLLNAQNCHECFDCFQIEECAYCTWIFESHHCYDVYGLGGSSYVLDCLGNENVNNVAFNTFVSDGGDIFYSDLCFYSNDLFGCVGLRNKKYCILNKQYSESDYKDLRQKIVAHMKSTGEWGQFFPVNLSPFAYNETAAQNYLPLNKEQAVSIGYRWRDPDHRDYQPQSIQVPEDIHEVQNNITEALLACSECGKNYKIIPQELVFYKKMNLPMPTKCHDCRYFDRLKLRNPRKLYIRKCDKCRSDMQTTYVPNNPAKVYCEHCYLETID